MEIDPQGDDPGKAEGQADSGYVLRRCEELIAMFEGAELVDGEDITLRSLKEQAARLRAEQGTESA